MGFFADNRATILKIAAGVAAAIIIISLTASAWDGIDAHEYGLLYYGVAVQLDNSRVYETGRHFVGLGNYFVKFPRSQQYLEFSFSEAKNGHGPLDVWSSDGQVIYIEASLYVALNPDWLHDLYYTYEATGWQKVVAALASETLRDVATRFDTLTFFTNRSVIDDEMQTALATRLYQSIHINLTTFNLLGIDVPSAFETAVLNKLISAQDVLTLQRLRDSQLIRQAVSVVDARGSANITILEATARARGLNITKSVEAELFLAYAEARATELAALATALGFTTPPQLLQYVYTDIVSAGESRSTGGGGAAETHMPGLAVNVPTGVVNV